MNGLTKVTVVLITLVVAIDHFSNQVPDGATKPARPEPCCFVAVSSQRRFTQNRVTESKSPQTTRGGRGAPLEPLVAVAILVACVVFVFPIVLAILPHVTAILPDVGLVVVQVAAIFAHIVAVNLKPRVDALGTVKSVIASAPEGTAVAEHDRRGNASFAPLVVMPAAIHKEHALPMPHAPAIRSMIPGAADVDRVVVILLVIRHVAGACTDDDCGNTNTNRYAGSGDIRRQSGGAQCANDES